VGAVHPLHVLKTEMAALRAAEPYEEKLRAAAYLGQPLTPDDVPGPTLSPDLVGFFFASGGAQSLLERQLGARARRYHERPRLAFVRHGYTIADWSNPKGARRFEEGIDLLNAPFVFAGPKDDAIALALRTGIADTALERNGASRVPDFNTLAVFAATSEQRIPLRTLGPSQHAILDTMALPAPIKNVLREDLAMGHAVIAPARLVSLNRTMTFGWWSVDLTSGYAIGRMELGGAQGLVEVTKTHERVTKWTEIYVKFMGGVLRCYMSALADTLGAVEFDGAQPQLTLNQGGPGETPMPPAGKLVECAIEKACDALAELLTDAMTEAALFADAEAMEELIAKWVEEKMIEKAGEGATGICNAVLTRAIG